VIGRFPWDPFPADAPEARGPDPLHVALYRGAMTGADAYHAVRLALRHEGAVLRVGNRFVPEGRYREVAFLAAGHAANSMALAALDALGDRLTQGFIASPDGPIARLPFRGVALSPGWGGSEEAHEVVEAAREIAAGLRASDLFLLLLSPGAVRALAVPPEGVAPERFADLLAEVHARGAGGAEVALLARVLGRGGVGGRLLPPTTTADVATLVVDRGDGAARVGGGPSVPLRAEEKEEARTIVERTGVRDLLPAAVREDLGRTAVDGALPTGSVHRPVVVAGPSDALRGAADAAFDRGWTTRVAFLGLEDGPDAAAARFLGRTEELVAQAAVGPGRTKGVVTVAMLTLGLPEGVGDADARRRFIEEALRRLRRREMSVGLYPTSGSIGPGVVAGFVVGAAADPDAPRPPGEIRPLAMRAGITDVGVVVAAVAPTERGSGSPSVPARR
jgi:glycerate-2-kinase